jgi:flagellar biosynthesis/type III secretory pathway protein FliH
MWMNKTFATVAAAAVLLAAPMTLTAEQRIFGGRDRQIAVSRDAYERGYREGVKQGEEDARRGRAFDYARDKVYRDGDRGYDQRDGSRAAYRDGFRSGFESGYRRGYDAVRVTRTGQGRRDGGVIGPRGARGYQEPAYARGYSDGFEKGLDDGRDRDRYDPVRHSDYREADQGYSGSYGSKDAYKNNYRSGFRQGYDAGYRDGTGGRRR